MEIARESSEGEEFARKYRTKNLQETLWWDGINETRALRNHLQKSRAQVSPLLKSSLILIWISWKHVSHAHRRIRLTFPTHRWRRPTFTKTDTKAYRSARKHRLCIETVSTLTPVTSEFSEVPWQLSKPPRHSPCQAKVARHLRTYRQLLNHGYTLQTLWTNEDKAGPCRSSQLLSLLQHFRGSPVRTRSIVCFQRGWCVF